MSFFIGLSALQSSQTALDIISQNIANASTPGYHRQSIHFESRNDDLFRGRRIGSGVSVNDIERIRFQVIESFLTETISDVNSVKQRLAVETQLETLFLPGDGTVQAVLDTLFGDIASLAANPSDATTRAVVIQSGAQLASQFRALSSELSQLRESLLSQIDVEITNLNSELVELNNLNQEIIVATATGGPPNGLLDQRDELINSIAERINVSRSEIDNGSINLTFGNYSIVATASAVEFESTLSADGEVAVTFDNGDRTLQLNSGRLASLVDAYNNLVPEYTAKLDELAGSLIRNFDQIHATGVGTEGPFTRLVGSRPVEFVNVPLAQAGAAFGVEDGTLFFSITDPSGVRRTESIVIDPETQSLDDVAAQISSIANLNASIDPQTNRLQITSSPGFQFDFTGSLANEPRLISYSGSAIPEISGFYDGNANGQFNFQIIGAGTVGVTDGLTLSVTDASGNPIASLNIGQGYEAGTRIEVAEGVEVTIPSGTVADGDTFEIDLVANPDETGLLSALGLNSFFSGSDAASIDIEQRIIDNPGLFSSSFSGNSAASGKVFEFNDLSNAKVLSDGRLTLSEYLIEVTGEIGVSVQTSQRLDSNLESLLGQYERERDSISGVDVNEEFVRLAQYQKSYEAAVRVIQTAEAVLDELFSIIR